MSTKKLYIFYFIIGIIGSVTIQMLPLVMTYKGFIPSQVAVIVSAVFLAALFQPFIGYLTRAKIGTLKMIQILLAVLIFMGIVIYTSTLYIPMLFFVLIFSVARLSISPIYDSYTTTAALEHGVNYGMARSGASLGFGIGMALFTALELTFDLNHSTAFIFISVLSVIGMMVISTLPKEKVQTKKHANDDSNTNVVKATLLIITFMLYFGALNMRVSYTSTYYIEFGYTTSFISLATFIMVIPEIIFLPLYNKLFSGFNKIMLLVLTVLLGIVQMVLYINFTANPAILLFSSLFNGLQIMLFFPTFFSMLQESLGAKNSSFGFVLNVTLQSIFVGAFNLICIRPLIIKYGSMIPVFKVIILVQIVSFIPIIIYYLLFEKNKKMSSK